MRAKRLRAVLANLTTGSVGPYDVTSAYITTAATSITCTTPAIQTGGWLYALVAVASGGAIYVVTPVGWSLVKKTDTELSTYLFMYKTQGSAPSTQEFALSSSAQASVICFTTRTGQQAWPAAAVETKANGITPSGGPVVCPAPSLYNVTAYHLAILSYRDRVSPFGITVLAGPSGYDVLKVSRGTTTTLADNMEQVVYGKDVIGSGTSTSVQLNSNFSGNDAAAIHDLLLLPAALVPPPPPVLTGAATTAFSATGTTTVVVNRPNGVTYGVLLIACGTAGSSGLGQWTQPSGWTEVVDDYGRFVAYKVAESSEPSSYTFTCPGAFNKRVSIVAVSGYSYASVGVFSSASTTPVLIPGITTDSGTFPFAVVAFTGAPNTTTADLGAPTGFTVWANHGGAPYQQNISFNMYGKNTATGNLTVATSPNGGRGVLVCLRPN